MFNRLLAGILGAVMLGSWHKLGLNDHIISGDSGHEYRTVHRYKSVYGYKAVIFPLSMLEYHDWGK